jgi:hypothetical protein
VTYEDSNHLSDQGAEVSRRDFLKGAAVSGAASILPAQAAVRQSNVGGQGSIVPNFVGEYGAPVADFQVQRRAMGKTGLQVSILGMGGFHLGTVAGQLEVNNMIAKAMDHGINFFDNAWEYHKGVSEERVGIALKGKRDQAIVMTKVCTHGRKKDVAMRMLEESLVRLQTDYLDVWQVHEVVYYNDPEKCYDADGVLEALTAAKQQGKVRFVGFTGHKNPSIHLAMLNGGYPFDTIQMPLNPFDYIQQLKYAPGGNHETVQGSEIIRDGNLHSRRYCSLLDVQKRRTSAQNCKECTIKSHRFPGLRSPYSCGEQSGCVSISYEAQRNSKTAKRKSSRPEKRRFSFSGTKALYSPFNDFARTQVPLSKKVQYAIAILCVPGIWQLFASLMESWLSRQPWTLLRHTQSGRRVGKPS